MVTSVKDAQHFSSPGILAPLRPPDGPFRSGKRPSHSLSCVTHCSNWNPYNPFISHYKPERTWTRLFVFCKRSLLALPSTPKARSTTQHFLMARVSPSISQEGRFGYRTKEIKEKNCVDTGVLGTICNSWPDAAASASV